jgi:glycosyltransferase involved in cell wall biosynthesis
MEAMACGVPVIGTNVGGVTELIQHGISGLVVSPSDEVSLKKAIVSYMENEQLRENVKREARQTIEAQFNLHLEIAKLGKLIEKYQES